MNTITYDLIFVSDNRLLAEAMGTALIAEGAISSYLHLRNGRGTKCAESVRENPAVIALDATAQTNCEELYSRIRRFAQELPTSRIVVIGDDRSADCLTGCIESGASAVVPICDSLSDLTATISALRDGHTRCSAAVIQAVLQRIRELSAAKLDEAGSDGPMLTEREVDILKLVEQGLLNKEIARRLGIAVSTVKNHLHAIFEKLGISGRRQAVRQGIALGILHCEREQFVA